MSKVATQQYVFVVSAEDYDFIFEEKSNQLCCIRSEGLPLPEYRVNCRKQKLHQWSMVEPCTDYTLLFIFLW